MGMWGALLCVYGTGSGMGACVYCVCECVGLSGYEHGVVQE